MFEVFYSSVGDRFCFHVVWMKGAEIYEQFHLCRKTEENCSVLKCTSELIYNLP